jgi:uncharacterized protein YecT (DUF1311 family)
MQAEPPPPPTANRTRNLWIAGLGLAILVGILIAMSLRGGGPGRDRLSDEDLVAAEEQQADPAATCASQQTYDELKRELFRKAAALRGRDEAAFEAIARSAMLSLDRPRLVEQESDVGLVRCAGRATVALPPGLAAGDGRSRVEGELGYAVQPAADGSGPTVTLTDGDAIAASLATLVRAGAPARPAPAPLPGPADPLAPAGEPTPRPTEPALGEPTVSPPPAVERAPAPSFNCARARTSGERAVCSSSELAALDRRMAAQYVGAVRAASPVQRALLQRTRDSFLAHRDQCPSDACIAQTYRGRMREIGDIMAGRWSPPR